MTNDIFTAETYSLRLRACRDEKFNAPHEFTNTLQSILAEHHIACSKSQLHALAYAAKGTFPTIDFLPAVAKSLGVSIGYLLGQHDMRDMQTESVIPDIRFSEWEREYKKTHAGRTLLSDQVLHPQWYSNIKTHDRPPQRLRPYLRVADALGWDIDYVLGVSKVKSWKYFCIEKNILETLPDKTLIYTGNEFALLSKDKDGFLLRSGALLPVEAIRQSGYEIVKKIYPL